MTVSRLLLPLLILTPLASAGATGSQSGDKAKSEASTTIVTPARSDTSTGDTKAKSEPPVETFRPATTSAAPAQAAGQKRGPETKADGAKNAEPKAKVAAPAKPAPPKTMIEARVDLSHQRMTVSVDGKPTYSWTVSSGATGYETPNGTFRGQRMHEMWRSRKYDDAPMPHSVFFHGGYAIHATYSTRSLGRPMSHGCVRLSSANARTFFNLVKQHGLRATKVVVTGKTPYNPPPVASRDSGPRGYGSSAFESSRGFSSAPPRVVYRDYPPTGARQLRWPGDPPSSGWGWSGGSSNYQRGTRTYYYRAR